MNQHNNSGNGTGRNNQDGRNNGNSAGRNRGNGAGSNGGNGAGRKSDNGMGQNNGNGTGRNNGNGAGRNNGNGAGWVNAKHPSNNGNGAGPVRANENSPDIPANEAPIYSGNNGAFSLNAKGSSAKHHNKKVAASHKSGSTSRQQSANGARGFEPNKEVDPDSSQDEAETQPRKMRAKVQRPSAYYIRHLIPYVQRRHNVKNLPVTSELQVDPLLQHYTSMAEKRALGTQQQQEKQMLQSQNNKRQFIQKLIKKSKFEQLINRLPFGQNLRVDVMIQEGNKKRAQAFIGYLMHRHRNFKNPTFMVQKWSRGSCVDRIFPLYCPDIVKMVVIDQADRA